MKKGIVLMMVIALTSVHLWSQTKQVELNITLDDINHTWSINQHIQYTNNTKDTLSTILLLDWNHAYADKHSPLGQRFLENYSKRFFFSTEKSRGYTQIKTIQQNAEQLKWQRPEDHPDQVLLDLSRPLLPGETVTLTLDYDIKLPDDKFTGHGYDDNGNYHLKDWYLIPADYKNGHWSGESNLNITSINHTPVKVDLMVHCPDYYNIESNLKVDKDSEVYHLSGQYTTGIKLEVIRDNRFRTFDTKHLTVVTDFNAELSDQTLENQLINRQIKFLEAHIGALDGDKIMVNQSDYNRNPLYGFNQLPAFLNPFPQSMTWELKFLKTLTDTYISTLISEHNQKKDWLSEGLTQYILYQYIATYYPNEKLIGNISKIWGVKFYHIADLPFNDRYFIGSQYNLRQNYDQDLKTPLKDLTNYNRQVGQPFKTVNLILYFEDFFGTTIIQRLIKETLDRSHPSTPNSTYFLNRIKALAPISMDTFIEQLYSGSSRIDYKLLQAKPLSDSIQIRLKNKEKLFAPIKIAGMQGDSLVSEYWLTPKDKKQQFKLPYKDETQWYLDPKKSLPDVNFNNNFIKTGSGIFRKPLSIRWLSDVDNETTTQVFIEPSFSYNYYDGISLISAIHNKSMFEKKWRFTLSPAYSFKSQDITGSASFKYHKYIDHKSINSFRIGLSSSYHHYKPTLAYRTLSFYANIFFKRKQLRVPKHSAANMSFTLIDKDPDPTSASDSNYNNYGVLWFSYYYSNPGIIKRFAVSQDLEIGREFSKLYAKVIFRSLISENRQFEARFFNGIFLYNKRDDDFFSFGVNRPNDYLFKYDYLGRSESTGFLSQQYIRNDGGFKAVMPVKYANQWINAVNTSTTIWRWVELYADAGLVKNRNTPMFFVHDTGIRLNFVDNMLEVYLPVHSNNGWEISEPAYHERIRFVLTTNLNSIFSFFKRGVL